MHTLRKSLEEVNSEKLLGIQIEQFNPCPGMNKSKTILFKLSLLKKIKEYLPLSTRKVFYNLNITTI